MADTPIDDRKFSDKEVREILKRAVETRPNQALATTDGLSLTELKAIGSEVGIDPARLEEAAKAVVGGGHRSNPILGAPTAVHFERKVPGEFETGDAHEIFSYIRRTMGRPGEVSETQGSLEWSSDGELGDRYVAVSRRDGSTTIRASANLSNLALVTYLPAGLVGAIVSLIGLLEFFKDGSEMGLVVALTVLPILYPILRTILGKLSGAETARLEQTVDGLARMMDEAED